MAAARALASTSLVCGLLALVPCLHATDTPDLVRIGMVQTLFGDVSPAMLSLAERPFKMLMKEQTGLDGKLVIGGDCYHVAKELNEGRLQLGVFNGVEFAWAQQRYQDLKPLMVTVNKEPFLQAYLVVRKDSEVSNLNQLEGKGVAIPNHTKHHARLFLEKLVNKLPGRKDSKKFFGNVSRPPHYEKALDDVVQGGIPVTVVDKASLETYQSVKPGAAGQLRVINDSELFPAAVIAYRAKGADQGAIAKFRDGMINANKDAKAQKLMRMFNIDAFCAVPTDYQQHLDSIYRAYPPPEGNADTTASKE